MLFQLRISGERLRQPRLSVWQRCQRPVAHALPERHSGSYCGLPCLLVASHSKLRHASVAMTWAGTVSTSEVTCPRARDACRPDDSARQQRATFAVSACVVALQPPREPSSSGNTFAGGVRSEDAQGHACSQSADSAQGRFPQRWAGPARGSDHNAGGGHANCSANWTFKSCSNQLVNVVAFRNATLVDSRCWQETPTIHDDSTERVSA